MTPFWLEFVKQVERGVAEELFTKICAEKDGKLTKEDFVHHVTHSDRIATCFYHLGINTETTNTDELWELFDVDDSGGIDQAGVFLASCRLLVSKRFWLHVNLTPICGHKQPVSSCSFPFGMPTFARLDLVNPVLTALCAFTIKFGSMPE